MVAPTKTEASASGGLGSLQQLYDMVAGKTSTTSGGTTTKVETGSMDQAGMNAMLQQALSSTSGLAAVAGGQRTAGGYGSTTNQMLVNDLLTRSAGQIAANNKTTTTSVTAPKQVVQSGGATVSGTAKVAALLKGMQLLQGKDTDLMSSIKKSLGMGESSTDYGNPANASISGQSNGNPNYYSTSESNMVTESSSVNAGLDLSSDMSMAPDLTNWSDTTLDTSSASESGPDLTNWSDTSAIDIPGITSSANDWVAAPDYVTQDFMPEVQNFADGGEVTAKKPSILGSSQFNTIKPVSNTSSDMSTNAANAPENAPVSSTQSSGGSLTSFANSIGTGGSGNGSINYSGSGIGGVGGASVGGISVGQVGTGLGIAGALMGDKNVSTLGTLTSIAGAPNPALAAGMTAANIATKGMAGTVMSAVTNPTLANITDIAATIANPMVGLANAALGLAGVNSIGNAMQNAIGSLSVEGPTSVSDAFSPMTQSIQAQQRDVSENPALDPVAAIENAIADDAAASAVDNTASGGGGYGANGYGAGTDGSTGGFQSSFGSGSVGGTGGGFGDGSASTGPGGSDSSSGVGGMSSGAGGTGTGGTGDADGGLKQGPGTGISDSIPTNLSNGEFVLSKDVVDAIGIDKLQALQDKYHTPAAVQRLQQFSRGRG